MKRYTVIIAAAVAVGLSGCSRAPGGAAAAAAAPVPALKVAGVTFSGRSRAVITAGLDALGLYPARVDLEYGCDYWAQGADAKTAAIFPGLDHVRVCYTAEGAWAETELVYGPEGGVTLSALQGARQPQQGWGGLAGHDASDRPTFAGLVRSITHEYGKPAQADAPEIGPQMALWQSSAGNILVQRTWPDQTLELHLADPQAYQTLQAEMQAQQAQQQKAANPLGG